MQTNIGYHIYLLNDKRKTKKITENETLYNFSQIFFKISNVDRKEINDIKVKLTNLKRSLNSCSKLDQVIKDTKEISGGNLGVLSAKSIDKKFLKVLEQGLRVGELSQIIITDDGVHSIMLCEPLITVNLDNLRKNIEQGLRINKINYAASSLLNSIRQRALIKINTI